MANLYGRFTSLYENISSFRMRRLRKFRIGIELLRLVQHRLRRRTREKTLQTVQILQQNLPTLRRNKITLPNLPQRQARLRSLRQNFQAPEPSERAQESPHKGEALQVRYMQQEVFV